MVEQVAHSHRVRGVPRVVERDAGHDGVDPRVEVEPAFGRQPQHAGGKHGLGDRADVHARIGRHRPARCGQPGGAERRRAAVVEPPHRAGDPLGGERLRDARLQAGCHGAAGRGERGEHQHGDHDAPAGGEGATAVVPWHRGSPFDGLVEPAAFHTRGRATPATSHRAAAPPPRAPSRSRGAPARRIDGARMCGETSKRAEPEGFPPSPEHERPRPRSRACVCPRTHFARPLASACVPCRERARPCRELRGARATPALRSPDPAAVHTRDARGARRTLPRTRPTPPRCLPAHPRVLARKQRRGRRTPSRGPCDPIRLRVAPRRRRVEDAPGVRATPATRSRADAGAPARTRLRARTRVPLGSPYRTGRPARTRPDARRTWAGGLRAGGALLANADARVRQNASHRATAPRVPGGQSSGSAGLLSDTTASRCGRRPQSRHDEPPRRSAHAARAGDSSRPSGPCIDTPIAEGYKSQARHRAQRAVGWGAAARSKSTALPATAAGTRGMPCAPSRSSS